MIYKNKSCKYIINKVYRDLNLKEDDRWMDMIEWIGECLSSIGAIPQYKKCAKRLEIENGMACLPLNFYQLLQVSYNGHPILPATGSFSGAITPYDNSVLDPLIIDLGANDINEGKILQQKGFGDGYIIDGNYIKTEFKTGIIYIVYYGIPVDDDGFPLVPDDISFDQACMWYIISRLVLGGYMFADRNMGFTYCQRLADYYISQARGKAAMPDIDQMENIKRMWVRMIPEMNRHSTFFNNLNAPESLRF